MLESKPRKILLIEDEELIVILLKRKLEKEGYKVSVANNGVEGMEQMREDKPDLILLDIIMPRMGGFEVMQEMRKDEHLRAIPIIIISNSGQPDLTLKRCSIKLKNKLVKYMAKAKQKILIVEDDKFLRDLITQKLRKEKFGTVEAVDGEQGLKKIKSEKPDLVLLDLILPGIDGFDVLTQIKKDHGLATIPVIILSNLGQKDDIERGLKLGATDYLIKAHFTPGEIIEKIKKTIG
jgi:CheY-like chemotaxis protein